MREWFHSTLLINCGRRSLYWGQYSFGRLYGPFELWITTTVTNAGTTLLDSVLQKTECSLCAVCVCGCFCLCVCVPCAVCVCVRVWIFLMFAVSFWRRFSLKKFKILAPHNTAERRFGVWIGGSILASVGTFHQVCYLSGKLDVGENIERKRNWQKVVNSGAHTIKSTTHYKHHAWRSVATQRAEIESGQWERREASRETAKESSEKGEERKEGTQRCW